jgi:hypothetical protein
MCRNAPRIMRGLSCITAPCEQGQSRFAQWRVVICATTRCFVRDISDQIVQSMLIAAKAKR